MTRGPAWCLCCLLCPGSPTPGCALVKEHLAWCLLWHTAPCLHLSSPIAHSIYYAAMLKPKQTKAGQNDPTTCLRPIQPLSGGTTHAASEPQQDRADWTVQRLQEASRPRNACLPSLGIFTAWCGVPGDILNNMSGIGIPVWGPDKVLAPTQWHGQRGLLQCITDTAHKNHCGQLRGKHPHLVSALPCPSSWRHPLIGPPTNASKSPCAKGHAHHLGLS